MLEPLLFSECVIANTWPNRVTGSVALLDTTTEDELLETVVLLLTHDVIEGNGAKRRNRSVLEETGYGIVCAT